MIIKYGDSKNGWSWISSVRQVSEVSDENIPDETTYVGSDYDSQCYHIIFNDGESEYMVLGVREIYLCNEETGSTIDVLRSGRKHD